MSLLWRKKCGEPCSICNNESTKTDLTCDFCGKKICSTNHRRNIEEEEETKSTTNNEKKVDSEITSKSGNGKQGNYQGTSHSKTQGHCGEKGQEISEVSTGDKGIRVLEKKKHQVCRMCYTVYKRKEHYTKEETKKKKEEEETKKEEEETKKEETKKVNIMKEKKTKEERETKKVETTKEGTTK